MYLTALKNFYSRLLCMLTAMVSLLSVSITSDALPISLAKIAGKPGLSCLSGVIANENDLSLNGVIVSMEKEQSYSPSFFPNDAVPVSTADVSIVLATPPVFRPKEYPG